MRKFALTQFRVPIAVLSVLSLALLAGCEGGTGGPSMGYYDYKAYLKKPHYRAFVTTGDAGGQGSAMWSWPSGHYSVEAAIEKGLTLCRGANTSEISIRAGECRLYAIGNIKVWDMTDEQLKKAIDLYKINPDATNADLALAGKTGEIAQPVGEGPKLSAAAYEVKGRSYAKEKNYDAAIEAFKKALDVDPNYLLAYNNLGNTYRMKGKYIDALEVYQKALEIDPNYYLAHANLGRLYRIMRRYDDSIFELEKAVELNPASAYTRRQLCWTLKTMGKKRMGKSADAIEACKEAIRLDPDSKFNYTALALVYRDRGKLEDAISALKKALEIDPDYIRAHDELDVIYRRQGRTDKAEEHSNIAKKLREQRSP